MFFILVLLAVSLQYTANATNILHVSTTGIDDTETLEYYLNNTREYFVSDTKLQFKSGNYELNVDLVVQNVINFSMVGEYSCEITCFSLVNIKIFHVKNFTLENIDFSNCNKNYSDDLQTTFDYDYISISKPSRNASILLYNCTSVVINNISVLVNAGTTGILVVNVRSYSTLTNVSITVNHTMCPTVYEHPEQINGILFYYDHYDNATTNVQLDKFQFTTSGSCAHPLQYTITLLLFQNNANVSFIINNTKFDNLINVSLLYYYGETCGSFVENSLTFTNYTIFNNTGYSSFKMFKIILYNQRCFNTASLRQFCNQQYNNISFRNCTFINNHNIESMINVTPASSRNKLSQDTFISQIIHSAITPIIENTTFNISFNTVYKVVRQTLTMGVSTKAVCGIQFYSKRGNLDEVNDKEWSFKVIAENNTHMTSKQLPGNSLLYTNCQWLAGTAFHTAKPTEVYKKVFRIHNFGNREY